MSHAARAERAKIIIRVTGQCAAISAPRERRPGIQTFQGLQAVVVGKRGHGACASGFDLRTHRFEAIVLPG
jgi:hypothetical protein